MELKWREGIRRRRTYFAGGFAGSLAREGGRGAAVVVFSVDADEGESEAESSLEERLSFKSTEAVSEKPLFPPLPLTVVDSLWSLADPPGRPSRNSVSSKLIISSCLFFFSGSSASNTSTESEQVRACVRANYGYLFLRWSWGKWSYSVKAKQRMRKWEMERSLALNDGFGDNNMGCSGAREPRR